MASFDYDRAAQGLVDFYFYDYKVAAKNAGVTAKTIYLWQDKMQTDKRLAAKFMEKKAELDKELNSLSSVSTEILPQDIKDPWIYEMIQAIRAGIRFLEKAADQADPTNPDSIHAIVGALKVETEILITKEVLDVKLAGLRIRGLGDEPLD